MTRAPSWWPDAAVSCYEDLVAYRLVGASACADRVTTALVAVSLESQERGRDVWKDLVFGSELLCELKPDTALYRNVVTMLTRAGRGGRAQDVQAAARYVADYRKAATSSVVTQAQMYLADAHTVLVHDYSSTVTRILQGLGATRPRRVVVTAGEPLGQGVKVAQLAAGAGHKVVYTPDMSVARVIDGVDCFLTGVESFYPDGSLANTVGTLMLTLLCREHEVPVIAPAESLKCDLRRASVTDASLAARLLHPWPSDTGLPLDAQVVQSVLDSVPATMVTTYLTEQGPCAPDRVGSLARQRSTELQRLLNGA